MWLQQSTVQLCSVSINFVAPRFGLISRKSARTVIADIKINPEIKSFYYQNALKNAFPRVRYTVWKQKEGEESDSSKANRPLPLRLAIFCNKLVKNFRVPLQFYVFSAA